MRRVGPVRRRRVNTVVVIPGTVCRPAYARNSAVDRRTRASGSRPSVAAMESDVCRVAVHAGGGHLDLVLPNAIAVGLLLPPLCDIVDAAPAPWRTRPGAHPRQLCPPGLPPLDPSKTLPENGIRDGDVLVLTAAPCARRDAAGAGHRRTAGPVDGIHRPVDPGGITGRGPDGHGCPRRDRRSPRGARITGRPAPAARGERGGRCRSHRRSLTVSGRIAFAAQAFGCALIAAATLCTSALGGTAHHTGLLLATVSTAVVVSAGRLTLLLCGLSSNAIRDLEPDADDEAEPPPFAGAVPDRARAGRGRGRHDLGVFLMLSSPGWADSAQAAAVTAALLLRARAQRAVPQRTALLVAGTARAAATLLAIRQLNPALAPWLCTLAAATAAAVLWFGHRAAPRGMAPVARHIATIAECAVLAAIVPLSCSGSRSLRRRPRAGSAMNRAAVASRIPLR